MATVFSMNSELRKIQLSINKRLSVQKIYYVFCINIKTTSLKVDVEKSNKPQIFRILPCLAAEKK